MCNDTVLFLVALVPIGLFLLGLVWGVAFVVMKINQEIDKDMDRNLDLMKWKKGQDREES